MGASVAQRAAARSGQPVVRALQAKDLPEAERIFRLAFGTFLGAPDPENFWRDRDYVRGRYQAPHVAAFGALIDTQLVGSAFATRWGSVAFLGPVTVHPDVHESGIGRMLLARTMTQFDDWQTRHGGLFTFAHSAKHVALYQKYGFYPRFLTAIMSKPIRSRQMPAGSLRFSELNDGERQQALRSSRELTDAIYAGFDLSEEIRAIDSQRLGDTVLVEGADGIAAFAACHYGPNSEAGADHCFIKFAAVREGPSAERDYLRLLDACEALGTAVDMPNLLAGTNLARREAYGRRSRRR